MYVNISTINQSDMGFINARTHQVTAMNRARAVPRLESQEVPGRGSANSMDLGLGDGLMTGEFDGKKEAPIDWFVIYNGK